MLDGVCREKIEKMIFAHLLIKYLKTMLKEGDNNVG